MLLAEILPGALPLPAFPEIEFPGVKLGPQGDWERAALVGLFVGPLAALAVIAFLTREG